MFFTTLYFDDLNNYCFFTEFYETIITIKSFLKYNFLTKKFDFNEIVKQTFDLYNEIINKLIINKPTIPLILFALLKKIISIWLDNIYLPNKKLLNITVLYLAFNDYYIIHQNENDIITYPIYDGNSGCDKSLYLFLMHTIITKVIFVINSIIIDENINKKLNYILINFRCGLIINQTNDLYDQYIIYNKKENEYYFFIYLDYLFLDNKIFYLDSFSSSKSLIQKNIRVQLVWIIEIFRDILIEENLLNINYSFYGMIMNYFDVEENLLNFIEIVYRFYLYNMKQLKDEMISLSVNKSFNKNVQVTKRINSKPRIKRRTKINHL